MRLACTVLLLLSSCAPPLVGSEGDEEGPHFLDDDFVLDPASRDRVGRFDQAVTSGDGVNGAHILFLNFDGATITRGSDSPSQNRSFIPNSATTVIPKFDDTRVAMFYTRAQAIDQVVNYSNGFYANYNVQIVSTRPPSGRYTMMMVGGTATLVGSGGGVVGIAPLDCGNGNENNVGFAFSASLIQSNRTTLNSANSALRQLALTIVHEAGHSYGLEHTNNQMDIMYPSVSSAQTSFGGPAGLAQPPRQCGSGTTQDTGGLLANNIGTRMGPLPDLGGSSADLGSKPPDLGAAAKDQGSSTKDQGGVAGADLADGTEDPPAGTVDGGGKPRVDPGCGCRVAGGDFETRVPLPALLLFGLVIALLRRGYME